MAVKNNTVKFGLSNVHYATLEVTGGVYTYGTPKKLLGGVKISLSPLGSDNPFYADNIMFYNEEVNQGYEGSLEIALLSDEFKADILGELSPAAGLKLEVGNAINKPFALGFQLDGDQSGTKYWLYHSTAKRPKVESGTNTDSKEVATTELEFTASPRLSEDMAVQLIATKEYADYATFFTNVVEPVVSTPVTVAGGK